MHKILFIGVNYKTTQHAINWVRSILTIDDCIIRVVVVDNSPGKDKFLLEQLRKVFPQVTYMPMEINSGYLNGAASVANFIDFKNFDWVVVSNVDVLLTTTNISNILEENNSKQIGMLAPSIISNKSMYDKNPYMVKEISRKKLVFLKFVYSKYFLFTFYTKMSIFKSAITNNINKKLFIKNHSEMFAPYGAVFWFSKNFFKLDGTITYKSFLYGEETYLGLLCKKLKLTVVYENQIEFLNFEHASTGQLKNYENQEYKSNSASFLLEYYDETVAGKR